MKSEYKYGVSKMTKYAIARFKGVRGTHNLSIKVFKYKDNSIELIYEPKDYSTNYARVLVSYKGVKDYAIQYTDGRIVWRGELPKYIIDYLKTIFRLLNKWSEEV